jgi:hypothetical protein
MKNDSQPAFRLVRSRRGVPTLESFPWKEQNREADELDPGDGEGETRHLLNFHC